MLLLFFVLGLAAAPSSRTSPFAVAGYMLVVPGLVLLAAVLLFTRSASPLGRSAGLLLAAAPAIILFVTKALTTVEIRQSLNADGKLVYFRDGPLREIAEAIAANDVGTIARLAPSVDVNKPGFSSYTLLGLALRRLKETPTDTAAIAILLKAGADPNLKSDDLPLQIAFQESEKAGAAPVVMLLKAGANPNTKSQFGTPVFFSATGRMMPPEVLAAVLEHGADLKATDNDGRNVLFYAANSSNWKAVLTLLERGADFRSGRTLNGETFPEMVESYARMFGDTAGVREVQTYLKQR